MAEDCQEVLDQPLVLRFVIDYQDTFEIAPKLSSFAKRMNYAAAPEPFDFISADKLL